MKQGLLSLVHLKNLLQQFQLFFRRHRGVEDHDIIEKIFVPGKEVGVVIQIEVQRISDDEIFPALGIFFIPAKSPVHHYRVEGINLKTQGCKLSAGKEMLFSYTMINSKNTVNLFKK